MKKTFDRPFLVSSAWFLALALLAFFPILFLGRAYDANDLLHWFGPMRAFLKNSLAQGVLPLWNPTIFCGQPYFADLQTQILYPLHWVTLPFSVPTGMSLFILIHWMLAATGARYWLRSLGVSEEASRIGALVFAFSGYFWWELIHPPIFAAFCWLPWLFGSLEILVRKPSPLRGWVTGFIFAMLFLAGAIQVSLGAGYFAVLYALFRYWNPGVQAERPALPRYLPALLGAALGVSIILAQLIPTQAYSKLSARQGVGASYENFNAHWSLQPSTLDQFLFPRMGVPKDKTIEQAIQEVTPDIGNPFLANFGYLGVWAPFLFFWAFREKNKALAWFLAVTAGIGVFTAFGKYFFLHKLLCDAAPGFNLLRAPFRYQYLYVLVFTALMALGYQALRRKTGSAEEQRGRNTALWVYGGILFLWGLAEPSANWREILSILLGVAGGLSLGRAGGEKPGRILLACALVGPLLLSGWGDFSTHPAEVLDLKASAPWWRPIQKLPKDQRLLMDPNLPVGVASGGSTYLTASPVNAACALGYKTKTGYNPLKLKSFEDIESLPFPLLSKLTALQRIVTTQKRLEIPGYVETDVDGLTVYESKPPMPHVYAPVRWRVEPDPNRRVAALQSPSFDPFQESILSSPPDIGSFPEKPVALQYLLADENPNYQKWHLKANVSCLAVFSEVAYPDWKARVDGRPVSLLTANHAFRALPIAAGDRVVEFRFEPSWRPYLFPGILGWILLSALWVFWASRRPRPSAEP